MIISALKGGLGNMLFQIAAGYSLANSIKTEFFYSFDFWHSFTNHKNENFEKTIFKSLNPIKIDKNLRFFNEKDLSYREIPKIDNQVLNGYFQSLNYFLKDENLIRKLFDVPIQNEYSDYSFIHVRRGDYVKLKNIFHFLGREYYERALEIIKPSKVILLTDSDGIDYEDSFFSQFEKPKEKSVIYDLSIMKSCKSGIIANSTFSWWGAFLSNSDEIIAPSKWFVREEFDTIIPKRWIKI